MSKAKRLRHEYYDRFEDLEELRSEIRILEQQVRRSE